MQEMVYLKAIQKISQMDISVSGTIDQKRIWKNLGGVQPPYPPRIRLWNSLSFQLSTEL